MCWGWLLVQPRFVRGFNARIFRGILTPAFFLGEKLKFCRDSESLHRFWRNPAR
jgi:hypothetical protein